MYWSMHRLLKQFLVKQIQTPSLKKINKIKYMKQKLTGNQGMEYSGHKTSLKFKRIQVIQSIFSAHN